MKETEYGDLRRSHLVHQPILVDENLTDCGDVELGHNVAPLTQGIQRLGCIQGALNKIYCCLRRILRDICCGFVESIASPLRPDHLSALRRHLLRSCSATSACVIVRPASASARPLATS